MQTTDILFLAIFIAILLVLYFNLHVNMDIKNMIAYTLCKQMKNDLPVNNSMQGSSVVETNFKVLTQ